MGSIILFAVLMFIIGAVLKLTKQPYSDAEN